MLKVRYCVNTVKEHFQNSLNFLKSISNVEINQFASFKQKKIQSLEPPYIYIKNGCVEGGGGYKFPNYVSFWILFLKT